MNVDIRRVRDDLDALRDAAGLGHDFGPAAVRSCLLFACAGAAACVWALVPHGLPPATALAAFAVPAVDWLMACKRSESVPPGADADWREWRKALPVFLLVLPLVSLHVWCRAVGLPPAQFLGLSTFAIGFVLFSSAVARRSQLPLVGWAVGLLAGGLLLPLDPARAVLVLSACVGAGALLSAGIASFVRPRGG